MKVRNLIHGSFAISFGTFVGGAISYVFSVVMGRLLGPAHFGDLGAIASFIVLITAVSGAIFTVVMHYAGQLYVKKSFTELKKLHRKISMSVLVVATALLIISFALVPWVVKIFSISDSQALYIALVAIVFSFLIVINKGVLQGTQQFWAITVVGILELAIKLAVAVVLVRAGLGLKGATTAMVVSIGSAYLVTLYMTQRLLNKPSNLAAQLPNHKSAEDVLERSDIMRYLVPTVFATLFLLVVMNLDVILVKHFFSPVDAGQYVAVSTIAKIIFYVTGPISLVMFPLITEQRTKGEKHYQTLLFSLILTIVASAILMTIYIIFQHKIIVALYGTQYGQLGYLLPQASWLVIALSLVNLMTQYFLSIRQFTFIYAYLPVIAGLMYFIFRQHDTIGHVIRLLEIGTALLFVLMLFNYLLTKRSQFSELLRAMQ